MKQFISFVRNEFYHILRDPLTLFIMFLLPIIMLIILGKAISTEFKNTSVAIWDQSNSPLSRDIVSDISNNNYFLVDNYASSNDQVDLLFKQGKIKAAIVIPTSFADDLLSTGSADIQLIADASDPNQASTINNYLQAIIMQSQQSGKAQLNIQIINQEVKMLFNPQMESSYNFVPGLIGMIMLLICALMTSISIVREKEQGTMEILLVSPLKPTSIILSKAIPYLLVSYVDIIIILCISYFIFGVPIVGSLFLLLLLCLVYTITSLSLGLLISSVTQTQQIAMMISIIGLMLPSMLLSGMIFPIENMPQILQIFSYIVPARWFIDALRNVMIEGNGFGAIWQQFFILIAMTLILLSASIKQFKNRL